ncbi:ribonuclease III [Rhodococcus aerolatus]
MSTNGQAGPRAALLASLGVDLDDDLLTLALTHRSYAYEHGGLPTNERLEFLGDSVLQVVVTERLYRDHPDLAEGTLAKLRSSVVNSRALAGVAGGLGDGGLGGCMLLGRGEQLTGGSAKSSIVGDAVEALIGAVHLEHGIETAREVVERLFADLLAAAPQLGAGLDWKTSLQELTARLELGVPSYEVSSVGPDHEKEFTARVSVDGEVRGEGTGRSKKVAEQKAAATAWQALSDSPADTPAGADILDAAEDDPDGA